MKKKIITANEFKKKLKSRLRSQRRIFKFDNSQILVLPHLEHKNIENSIDKIKFYIDNKGKHISINDFESIVKITETGIINLKLNNGELTPLYHRNMKGEYQEINSEKFKIKELTIDHSPSIQIVLFTMYLNKEENFKILSQFSKSLDEKLTTKSIKTSLFKKKIEKVLSELPKTEKELIEKAYKSLFNKIELEITTSEFNNANLSIESLEYYKNHIG